MQNQGASAQELLALLLLALPSVLTRQKLLLLLELTERHHTLAAGEDLGSETQRFFR